MYYIVAMKSKSMYKYVPIRMDLDTYQRIKSTIKEIGKELDDKKTISSWIRDAIEEKLAKEEILYKKRKGFNHEKTTRINHSR